MSQIKAISNAIKENDMILVKDLIKASIDKMTNYQLISIFNKLDKWRHEMIKNHTYEIFSGIMSWNLNNILLIIYDHMIANKRKLVTNYNNLIRYYRLYTKLSNCYVSRISDLDQGYSKDKKIVNCLIMESIRSGDLKMFHRLSMMSGYDVNYNRGCMINSAIRSYCYNCDHLSSDVPPITLSTDRKKIIIYLLNDPKINTKVIDNQLENLVFEPLYIDNNFIKYILGKITTKYSKKQLVAMCIFNNRIKLAKEWIKEYGFDDGQIDDALVLKPYGGYDSCPHYFGSNSYLDVILNVFKFMDHVKGSYPKTMKRLTRMKNCYMTDIHMFSFSSNYKISEHQCRSISKIINKIDQLCGDVYDSDKCRIKYATRINPILASFEEEQLND